MSDLYDRGLQHDLEVMSAMERRRALKWLGGLSLLPLFDDPGWAPPPRRALTAYVPPAARPTNATVPAAAANTRPRPRRAVGAGAGAV